MRILRRFKRKPPEVHVHVYANGSDVDWVLVADKIRAELVRAARRNGGKTGIE